MKTFELNGNTVTIKKDPESISNAIRSWELTAGETYLEYDDFFTDASTIMQFAYKKGYIDKDKFELWKIGFNDNEMGSEETFEVIFGEDTEYEPYCITYYKEPEGALPVDFADNYNKQYSKALLVYGELICSNDEYYNKFLETFEEKVNPYL